MTCFKKPDPDANPKRQHFLDRAKHAEETAAKTEDMEAKANWLKMAEQYRALADLA